MIKYIILIGAMLITGCSTTVKEIVTPKGNTAFESWLLTYETPGLGYQLSKKDANRCIKILQNPIKQEELEDAAILFLEFFYDWNKNQIKAITSVQKKLSYDNQDDLLMLYETLPGKEDFSSATTKAYVNGLVRLMQQTTGKDNREYAADMASDVAYPSLMKIAYKNWEGEWTPEHKTFKYFASNYAWFWVDVEVNPKRTFKKRWSKWWKKNKKQWIKDYVDLKVPNKFTKQGSNYVYIFSVSDYPSKWGTGIDLPGVALDAPFVEAWAKTLPRLETLEIYENEQATTKKLYEVIDGIQNLSWDAKVFIYFTGHGSFDGRYILLTHDFEYDFNSQKFVNVPVGKELQTKLLKAPLETQMTKVMLVDACNSGGLARNTLGQVKYWHPQSSVPNFIPNTYYNKIFKSGNIWITACGADQYSYATTTGSSFTKTFFPLWKDKLYKNSINALTKKTGRILLKAGFPQTPELVCPKGDQKFKIFKNRK